MKFPQRLLILAGMAAVVLIIAAALTPSAKAIPAFSARHGFSCNVCHTNEFPRLNRFGYEYKLRGYRFAFEKGEKVKSPSDLVSAVYKFTNTRTRPAGKPWQNDTAFKDVDLFGTYQFGPKGEFSFFGEVDLIEGVLMNEGRWLKAANVVATFGDEHNTFQVRGGRLPQFRGSMFMGADRYALGQPFIMSDGVQGHAFGKNYGLGAEFVYTHNLNTTFRAFGMRLDETKGYRDSKTFGFGAQHLLGAGDSSFSFSLVRSIQPRLAGGEAHITRAYATGSWDANPKVLVLGGLAGGTSRAWNGVERNDLGFYGEVDIRPLPTLTFISRYDEIDFDWRSLTPKRGVSQGLLWQVYARNNFNVRAFGEYGNTFNIGLKNKQVAKFGFTVSF